MYLGSCPDLANRLNIECNCCETCHTDDDEGYDSLQQLEFEDGYYDVCCKVREVYETRRVNGILPLV